MECVVKNCNLGNTCAENFVTALDTYNVCGIVQGSKGAEVGYRLENAVINKNALGENIAALNNSVTDGADFGKVVYNFAIARCESVLNDVESNLVVGDIYVAVETSAVKGGTFCVAHIRSD